MTAATLVQSRFISIIIRNAAIGPTIEVHAICWNEERLLPLFLNHYSGFASRIVVWDNHSDDSSRELIEACPLAGVRLYDSGGFSDDSRYLEIKNNCWKGSSADWVIVCDIDCESA